MHRAVAYRIRPSERRLGVAASVTERISHGSARGRLSAGASVPGGIPAKDLLLARWCQDKKLSEEAQFHWLNVLRAQPNHEEALRTSKCSGTTVSS